MLKIKKSKLLLTLLLISILLLSACGTAQNSGSSTTGSSSTTEYKPTTSSEGELGGQGQTSENKKANVKEQQSLTLTFYYVDEELLTMKEKEKTISYFDGDEMWTALWQELQDSGEEGFISLWEDVKLIEMEVKNNVLSVNIAKPENLQFGSTAEGFAIQTLLQTVGQIEDIEAVQLLIEGEVEETLAGHVSIDQPIGIDELIYTGQ